MPAKLRWILIVIVLVLLTVIALQNRETVETRLLFATVSMPRALLLLTSTLVGFALGVLTCFLLLRRKRPPSGGS